MVAGEVTPLVTERLVLRLVDGGDEDAIHKFRGGAAATQFLSHGPLDVEANRERLAQLVALVKWPQSSQQFTNPTVPPSGSCKALVSGGTPASLPARTRPARASPC
jgi:hypothetical protein